MDEDFRGLQKFLVRNVVRTRRELGVGAHGSVEELQADGMIYAGKKIHDALVEFSINNAVVTQRFVEECQLMSDLRHPHVVQFIGVCFLSGSRLPVLVMEYLPENLDDLLEATSNIPLFLKRCILHDVALGLVYLHSHVPPIIHRDLTARNVLLNSDMRAKIADFGVARILGLRPGSRTTMTQAPGNFTYMPPEALCTKPIYDMKIDIFSFGHLALFTLTQVFPNLLPSTYTSREDPARIVGRSEVERRSREVDLLYRQLGEQHPLVQLVLVCLQNRPELRPSTQQVVRILESAKGGMVDPYSHLSRLQLLQVVDHKENEIADMQKKLKSKEAELGAKEAAVEHYREAYSELQLQIRENRLSSKDKEDKEVDRDATNVSEGAPLPTPEDKQKGNLRQKVEKYNKRIIEAVQSWIQQLRTPKRDWKQKESELPSSDPVSMDDTSDKELADKPPKSEALTLALSPHSEMLSWKGRELTVKFSDIAREEADIIVVCNNTLLVDDGGGVYGAVNRESLGILEENCSKYIRRCGPVEVGRIALTEAGGNLRCKWVIHAIGPQNYYFPDTCRALLSQAVRETLQQAEQLKAISIAFPAISTGDFGVSGELSAKAIIDTILDYKFSEQSTLADIRIVIIDHRVYSCFATHLVLKRSEQVQH